jgi:hypothetical protein
MLRHENVNDSRLHLITHIIVLVTMDANGDLNVLVLAAVALADHGGQPQPIPQHNSMLTGALYYEEIMATVDENRFLHVARMDKATFILLKDLLMGIRGLLDFLYICARINDSPLWYARTYES